MSAVIKVKELNESNILSQFRYKNYCKENDEYTDWLRIEPNQIIDHIVYSHHAYLNDELPKIGQLLFNVLKTHGKIHQELIEIYILFSDLKRELENHIAKEEEFIFPAMRIYERFKTAENRNELLERINAIEGEHRAAGNIIKKIREITNQFVLPTDGSRTYELAYNKLAETEKDIFQHIHILKIFYLKIYAECMEPDSFGQTL